MRDDVKANAMTLFGTGSMCVATDDSGVAVDGSEDCQGCRQRLLAVEDDDNLGGRRQRKKTAVRQRR